MGAGPGLAVRSVPKCLPWPLKVLLRVPAMTLIVARTNVTDRSNFAALTRYWRWTLTKRFSRREGAAKLLTGGTLLLPRGVRSPAAYSLQASLRYATSTSWPLFPAPAML